MSKKLAIGEMRHRITFQDSVETPDGHKGHTTTWSYKVTVWGSLEPLSGREFFAAHQTQAEVTHRVKIRYRADITTKMRIKYKERILEIESILDLKERHQILEILCREAK